jgi:hypothetical protein
MILACRTEPEINLTLKLYKNELVPPGPSRKLYLTRSITIPAAIVLPISLMQILVTFPLSKTA